ncbi:unnamed protein product [Rhizoctonia solani]|uniref:NACHT domain-containing protein n=1 Tax=Rhizoctonia solani TaxID=456999 RepID=A0A8H3CWQ1_9AGAM|nr:unnamed protein product [Rhizoctonia solani]
MTSKKSKKSTNLRTSIRNLFRLGSQSQSSAYTHGQPTDSSIHESTVSQRLETTTENLASDTVVQNDITALAAASNLSPPDDRVAWNGLKALLQVLESAGSLFVPFKMVIAEFSSIVDVYDCATNGQEDYRRLSKDLDDLFLDLKGFLEGPVIPIMTPSIKNLCASLKSELNWARSKQTRGPTQRYAEAREDADALMESYQRIHGYIARLTLNMNMGLWKVLDGQVAVLDSQVAEGRLKELSPSFSAIYNSAESEDIDRGPCTPGTRTAELERLLTWTARSLTDRKGVYWMNGMAGTGKTTIAYSLCTSLEEQGRLAASFFCSRLIPKCRNVKLIIPTLAYQLARSSHPFRSALSQALEVDPDAHTRSLKVQFDSLIAKPSLEVQHTLPEDLVVVVDALDECENENSIGQFLDILLSNSEIPIRFLISSRPEPEIYRRMMLQLGQDSGSRLVLHELEAAKVKHDIETYLRQELEGVPLTAEQFSGIVEKCGVLFIYASTVARYIKDGLTLSVHEERVDAIIGLSTGSPGNRHRVLDELYSTILRIALQNPKLDESDRTLLKALLDLVVCVQEPITTSTLAGLLGLTGGQQVEGFLRSLHSVLQIAEKTGLVTTLHTSFPDFMFDSRRSGNLHFLEPLEGHNDSVFCVRFSHRGTSIASGSGDRSILIWDTRTGDIASDPLTGHTGHVRTVEFFPDDTRLISGDDDGVVRVWSVQTGDTIISYTIHSDAITSISLSPDGSLAASGCMDHTIKTWDPTNGDILKTFDGHTNSVHAVQFSPNGLWIASASHDMTVRVWDKSGQTIIGPLQGHTNPIRSIAFTPDNSRLVTCADDNTVRVWDIQNPQHNVHPPSEHTDWVDSACYSGDGTRIISGSFDRTICVWNADDGQLLVGPLKGHQSAVLSIDISPDGSRIISGSRDRTVRMWDTQSGELVLEPIEVHTGSIYSVAFSPDGKCFASGSRDGTVQLWDAQTGSELIYIPKGHRSAVNCLRFSPVGLKLVSCSDDQTLCIWDSSTGAVKIGPLQGHAGEINTVAFSPDGLSVVSGSEDCTLRLWDAQTGLAIRSPFIGHTQGVTSVDFSPDGKYIVSSSDDFTIRVWETQSGQTVVGPLKADPNYVESVRFSPDGSRVVSGGADLAIRVWDIQTSLKGKGPQAKGIYENWVMDDDGWIKGPESECLAWVPPDLRPSLLRPQNKLVISPRGWLKLGFDKANIGRAWVNCYEPIGSHEIHGGRPS